MGAAALAACATGSSSGGRADAAGVPGIDAPVVDTRYVFRDVSALIDARVDEGAAVALPDSAPELDAYRPVDAALSDTYRPIDAAFPDSALAPDAYRPVDAALPDTASTPDAPSALVVSFSAGSDTAQRGSPLGGTAYSDVCPAGQALVGFVGSIRSTTGYHGKIAAKCGVATLVTGGGAPGISVSAGDTLPTRGLIGSAAWERTCPENQLIVGFGGRAGHMVDQLVFRCAALVVAPDDYAITRGATTDLDPVGGSGGTRFDQTDCPPPQVGIGAIMRAGDGIDAFGLRCGVPTVN